MTMRCLVVGAAPLHDVYRDLLEGLTLLGWQVELSTLPPAPLPRSAWWSRVERALSSRSAIVRAVARALRRAHREVAGAAAASRWFTGLEARLAEGRDDVVLAFADIAPVGLTRLIARSGRPAVISNMLALTQELEHRAELAALRVLTALTTRGHVHPDVLRPIGPALDCVVTFHSASWRDGARAAGLQARRMEVIPLGVRVPDLVPERVSTLPVPARLVWVGRLSPEKGPHLFLEALPLVLSHQRVRLTMIAAPGADAYSRDVHVTIERLHLEDVVQVRPPVSRTEMIAEFGRHDVLLFHSVFAEPVAQVMLHAAAAGLPIVGPQSRCESGLLREGETAWCYADESGQQIADAIIRALAAGDERHRRACALREEIRQGHDLARTIERYDACLRAACGDPWRGSDSCQNVRC